MDNGPNGSPNGTYLFSGPNGTYLFRVMVLQSCKIKCLWKTGFVEFSHKCASKILLALDRHRNQGKEGQRGLSCDFCNIKEIF